MISVEQRWPRLSRGAAVVAWLAGLVVVVGGVVRVAEAGLGCPDWPLCYGRVVPPFVGPAAIEFTHRLVAGLFSIGVAWLAWRGWRQRHQAGGPPGAQLARQGLARVGLAAVALVLVQVVLGGLNVLTELAPGVGATHLTVAMGLVALLAAASQLARLSEQPPAGLAPEGWATVQRRLRWVAWATGLALVVVGVGGYMRALGASLACYDWPLCRGRWLPEPAWPVVLHWSHRAAAFVLGCVLAVGWRRAGGALGWALGLYTLQVVVGALSVWWTLPPVLRVLHLALATAVVGVLAAELARLTVQARVAGGPVHGSRTPG